jgi:hypothetical protein
MKKTIEAFFKYGDGAKEIDKLIGKSVRWGGSLG